MEVADRTEADRKGGHIARRARRRAACCARPRRRPTRTSTPSRTSAATATSTPTTSGSTSSALRARAGRARRRARAADDRQPQDASTRRDKSHARGLPARDRDGRGDRRLRRRARRCASRARASRPSRRPSDLLVAALGRLRADRRRARRAGGRRDGAPPVVDLDDDHYKLLADFERALPGRARRRSSPASALTVRGRRRFGAAWCAAATVTVTGPLRVPDGAVLEG